MYLGKTSNSQYLRSSANSAESLKIKNKLSIEGKVELDENGKPKVVNGKYQWTAEWQAELDRENRRISNETAINFLKNSLSVPYGAKSVSNITTFQGQNLWLAKSGQQYTFKVHYGAQDSYRFAKSNMEGMPYQTPLQINALGESTKLRTAMGDAEVFLDMFGDNDSLGLGEVGKLGNLFSFDSNGDGFLNHEDELFSKLKIRVDKGNGEFRIANLSDVVSQIDLYDFVKGYDKSIGYDGLTLAEIKQYRANYHFQKIPNEMKLDPYTDIRAFRGGEMSLFPPEQHYKRIDDKDIRAMFEAYADKEGWINLQDKEVNEALFASGDFITNFAYKKTNLAGVEVLEEFNIVDRLDNGSRPSPFYEGTNIREFEEKWNRIHPNTRPSYEERYKEAFDYLYDSYYQNKASFEESKQKLLENEYVDEELKDKINALEESSAMGAIRQQFYDITGIEFSEERLEKLKSALENPQVAKEAIAAMKDTDAVTSMRLENDGRILLRFDSGREILVDGLYNDTGELLITKKGDRASESLSARSMSDEELSKIDFSEYGIKQGEDIVSLQDIGAEMIRKLVNENGKFLGFVINIAGQKQEQIVENLYNIYTINNFNKTRNFQLEA